MQEGRRLLALPKNGDTRDAAAHHRYFVATMQTRAVLAILEDLVGQFRLVFNGAEAILEKEVGDARKQAHGLDAVLLGFLNQRAEDAAAVTGN